ncbi:hypothetical protein IQ266_18555 [filamentous cyanobacterium LEGE 11480]|uniref:Uncharacterized protein n=1 Tax=Romeriopsis navalis LEGE 11480 TaxID=2777977 RepID=A0A928VNA0_9CYAN|nr:hypothetical protein [Romeriopsis navalis]MBE9031738.1 hypothetical protein [Romeriopsis navalis LEGE 11480]
MKKRTAIISSILILGTPIPAQAKPGNPTSAVPADVPEEVLQNQIITSARSPIDNQPLTATEYAELKTNIDQANQVPPKLSRKIRSTVGLLKLRKFLKTVLPFIPIK